MCESDSNFDVDKLRIHSAVVMISSTCTSTAPLLQEPQNLKKPDYHHWAFIILKKLFHVNKKEKRRAWVPEHFRAVMGALQLQPTAQQHDTCVRSCTVNTRTPRSLNNVVAKIKISIFIFIADNMIGMGPRR